MDDVLAALAEQHAELGALIAPLDEASWTLPSRCAGWSIADVVLHMAQTDEMAVGSLEGRYGEVVAALAEGLPPAGDVDEGVALMVAAQRGGSGAATGRRWSDAAAALRAAFASVDLRSRVTWVAGELSARTLAATRLAECWIHTGDVAHGLGVTLAPAPRLVHVARLAWRTLPYAFARDDRTLSGPVAFELQGPGGEPWSFQPEEPAATVVRGSGADLCEVAARRRDPASADLRAEGPDADAVLHLVRTYA